MPKSCLVNECSGALHAKGYCRRHYLKWKQYGDPLGGVRAESGELYRWLVEHVGKAGDECIEWPFHRSKDGYGQIRRNRRSVRAHRLAYEIAVGPIPEGAVIMHECDNPPCVNPNHLKPGSCRDNTLDAVQRGLHPLGSRNGQSKLTEADVRDILASQEPGTALADRYGVSASLISQIRRRVAWRHMTWQTFIRPERVRAEFGR